MLITSRNPAWRGIAATVGVREFTRAESIDAAAPAGARPAPRPRRIGWPKRSAICRWRSSRPGRCWPTPAWTVDKYLRLLAERARTCWTTTRWGLPAVGGRVVGGGVRPARRRRPDRAGPADAGGVVRPGAGPADPAHRPPRRPPRARCGRSSTTPWCWRAAPRSCTGGAWPRCPHTASSCTGSRQRCCAPAAKRSDVTAAAGWAATVVRLLDQAAPGDVRIDPAGGRSGRQLLPHVLAAAGHDAGPRRGSGRRHPTTRSRRRRTCSPVASPRPPCRCSNAPTTSARERFGDDHPDTLTSASNLALNLWWLGEYQRARALDDDTLTRRRRILGDDHPDTLTSASQLAVDLSRAGRLPAGPRTPGRDAEPAAPNPRRRPPRHPHLGQPTRPATCASLGDYQQARQL